MLLNVKDDLQVGSEQKGVYTLNILSLGFTVGLSLLSIIFTLSPANILKDYGITPCPIL
jgi:hypothetical protein